VPDKAPFAVLPLLVAGDLCQRALPSRSYQLFFTKSLRNLAAFGVFRLTVKAAFWLRRDCSTLAACRILFAKDFSDLSHLLVLFVAITLYD